MRSPLRHFLPLLFAASCCKVALAANPYISPQAEKAIADALAQMTLEEKIKFCQGDIEGKAPPSRGSAALDRLGIRPMVFYNGPRGYQMGKGTVFPAPIGQGATWDAELLTDIARVIALESLAGKTDCLEAPQMNIIRDPLAGRNFESFTEDPYLNGKLTAAFVRGVQDAGAPATLKGLISYNQETNRTSVDAVVDERALREIYLPAFQAGIDAGVLGIMTSPSQVNGVPASANHEVIDIIKKEFGFKGFVLTDWNGVQDTVNSANAGTDLSMPGKPEGKFSADKLMAAVKGGQVSEQVITDKVRRLLRAVYFAGLMKGGPPHPAGEKPCGAHYQVEAAAAEQSMVLLKNKDNLLPLDPARIKKVAVLGPNAAKKFPGGGSSGAGMIYEVNALQGIEKRLGKDKVQYLPLAADGVYEAVDESFVKTADGHPGFDAVYRGKTPNSSQKADVNTTVPSINFNWEMASPDRERIDSEKFSARWTGTLTPPLDGSYTFRIVSSGKGHLTVNGKAVIDKLFYVREREGSVELKAGTAVPVEISFDKAGPQGADSMVRFEWVRPDFATRFSSKMDASVQAAKNADAAIVCVGLDHSYDTEGSDRKDLALPAYQVEFLRAVAKANPRTVIVMYAGSVIDVQSWINDVNALVLPWYPGIENGNALARVLFGDVTPSGKLTITFPKKYEDSPAHPSRQNEDKTKKIMHNEGIFVGYRWYEHEGIQPMFPFGFGLSYTSFGYQLKAPAAFTYQKGGKAVEISVDITNLGKREGAEIAQLYVHTDKPVIPRPPQELKGFQRLLLKPGETKTAKFSLDDSAFAYWNPKTRAWTLDSGTYEVRVGSSSQDVRARATIEVK